MSNYLAIATVTATLQRILQNAIQLELPGAEITTVKPSSSETGMPKLGVNLYLYQVSPNPAWRNADLRTRRPKGELIKQAQAGVDLHYLMTFYGNEIQLQPQRLLGVAVRTLVDYPILTSEMILETLNKSNYDFLAGSTLAEQVERVTVVPSPMTVEDLSKIWSVFLQTPYMLSFACQGSVILIESNKPSGRALPVRNIQFYTTPNHPIVEQVMSESEDTQTILANSTLIVRGKQLNAEVTPLELAKMKRNNPQGRGAPSIEIGKARVKPQKVTATEIQLDLASLSVEERNLLRLGVQSLQVIYPILPKRTLKEPDRAVRSNAVPFVLRPTIAEIEVSDLINGDEEYSAELQVQVDLKVGSQQRVLLFLNERSNYNPAAYIFAAKLRGEDTNLVVFPIVDVKAGEYLVRVQVDGAESLLNVDTASESETFDRYVSPIVAIG